jgi:glycosyltransferase involved in cell wall biosynthesis
LAGTDPLPKNILFSICARIGGSGLDSDSFECLKASFGAGILGAAVAFDNRQTLIPPKLIRSLRWHPVRLLSFLGSKYYYGAKKHALDSVTARMIATGKYDLFHSWAGDCLETLRQAKKMGIPTVLEIPTWHRNKGVNKPDRLTKTEREQARAKGFEGWRNRLLVTRQQQLEEYQLADVILVLSSKAEETFLAAGVPKEKLFSLPRGTDPARFSPAPEGLPAPTQDGVRFRAVFTGALIKRKGVHTLLEAWHRLKLKQAELVLVGAVHEEIKPYLERFADATVRLTGFVKSPEAMYRQAHLHVFPSTCEGSAKVTYDAAACGLPQITTHEAGDVVIDGLNGLVVPCNDVAALAQALQKLYDHPELLARMGVAARQRIVQELTWDHYRARLLEAYRLALKKA